MTALQLSPDQRIKFTTVERMPGGEFLVDWEVTEGYQDMPLADFKLARPADPKRFRVFAKESDYFNGDFGDPARFRCYKLTSPADEEFLVWGYTEIGTPLEEALAELLPLGAGASVILDLAYPENPVTSDQVRIAALAHPNWFPEENFE
jgi:hypothetical protein